jgi:PPOX class probable F420-dependent enzyme
MTQPLPDEAKPLFDEPYYATITTVEPNGQPQVTAVWTTRDGDDVLVSTVRGRRKEQNMSREPRATVFVLDPKDPWHFVEVRGRATIKDDPEGELIQELSHRYLGGPYTYDPPDAQRVIVRISPERVNFSPGGRR